MIHLNMERETWDDLLAALACASTRHEPEFLPLGLWRKCLSEALVEDGPAIPSPPAPADAPADAPAAIPSPPAGQVLIEILGDEAPPTPEEVEEEEAKLDAGVYGTRPTVPFRETPNERRTFPEEPIAMRSPKWLSAPTAGETKGTNGVGSTRAQQIKWFLNRGFSYDDLAVTFHTVRATIRRIALGVSYGYARTPQRVPWFDGSGLEDTPIRELPETEKRHMETGNRYASLDETTVAIIKRAWIKLGRTFSPDGRGKGKMTFAAKWVSLTGYGLTTVLNILAGSSHRNVAPASSRALKRYEKEHPWTGKSAYGKPSNNGTASNSEGE